MLEQINAILAEIPQEERNDIMDAAVANQPSSSDEEETTFFQRLQQIVKQYG